MTKDNKLTVCFFGIYNPEYSRNRVLIEGLKQNGVEVIECRSEKTGFLKYFDLIKKHWKIRKQYDVLFVAFPGFQVMILAKFLTSKKIIFDCFAPLYESEVLDRQKTKKGSLRAKYYWFLDKFSAKLADKVLLDTNEHIKYFVEEFGFNPSADGKKFERIFIGVDNNFFESPVKKGKEQEKFVVHFHGTNIPLQGIKCILEASYLLRGYLDINFIFVGPNIKDDKRYSSYFFDNIETVGKVPYYEMPKYIDQADLCLGIFGNTEKTQRVIPNKVFECVSRKKPTITVGSPAVMELFSENDLFFVSVDDSQELAGAILSLKNNPNMMEKLAENGYNRFIQSSTPIILGKELKNIIQDLI